MIHLLISKVKWKVQKIRTIKKLQTHRRDQNKKAAPLKDFKNMRTIHAIKTIKAHFGHYKHTNLVKDRLD